MLWMFYEKVTPELLLRGPEETTGEQEVDAAETENTVSAWSRSCMEGELTYLTAKWLRSEGLGISQA